LKDSTPSSRFPFLQEQGSAIRHVALMNGKACAARTVIDKKLDGRCKVRTCDPGRVNLPGDEFPQRISNPFRRFPTFPNLAVWVYSSKLRGTIESVPVCFN
jgi:hypothetical protein